MLMTLNFSTLAIALIMIAVRLQNALEHISSWMTANHFTLIVISVVYN